MIIIISTVILIGLYNRIAAQTEIYQWLKTTEMQISVKIPLQPITRYREICRCLTGKVKWEKEGVRRGEKIEYLEKIWFVTTTFILLYWGSKLLPSSFLNSVDCFPIPTPAYVMLLFFFLSLFVIPSGAPGTNIRRPLLSCMQEQHGCVWWTGFRRQSCTASRSLRYVIEYRQLKRQAVATSDEWRLNRGYCNQSNGMEVRMNGEVSIISNPIQSDDNDLSVWQTFIFFTLNHTLYCLLLFFPHCPSTLHNLTSFCLKFIWLLEYKL